MQVLRVRAGSLAMAMLRWWLPACGLLVQAQAHAQAQGQGQVLTLHYQERAPYSWLQADGSVVGLVASPASQALKEAGVQFAWARTPSQRQLALIQEGAGLHCGLGWFRNAERATLGKFSKPLYRDKPFAALARSDSALRPGSSVAQAFAQAGGSLLVKEGYSYGPELDRLIAAQEPRPQQTSAEPAQMLRMLLAGRAGWMIVAPEESRQLREDAGPGAAQLRELAFADAGAGQARHLYCNHAVPDAWLQRVDQALAAQAR